ncbi:MAG: Ldh family oxidoreductase, partial [Hyphomicrobiaceae bacterium]
GTFALRLAGRGLMALAATNGSPLLAASGATQPIYCTNPIAFAAPAGSASPLLIDQSCSATAYVNIRAAAERGDPIPSGWAIDRHGNPTTDPNAAMDGAMVAFGGPRGANLALMVEILAAGVGSANWSVDAAPFDRGSECPATGLSVIAINAEAAAPDFAPRIGSYLGRLDGEFGVHVPGRSKSRHRQAATKNGLSIQDGLITQLEALAHTFPENA